MLHLILHYFLLTNYAWMLCEGFYLHTVLVSAFISEQKLVRWLIALGWSAPAAFLMLYGTMRGFFSEDHDRILLVIHGKTQIIHVISLMNISDAG
jgi:calcitonin receptor-like